MFILHITPNIYLTEHQTSQLLLPFLLTLSARPPKESPTPVISLMGIAPDEVALGEVNLLCEFTTMHKDLCAKRARIPQSEMPSDLLTNSEPETHNNIRTSHQEVEDGSVYCLYNHG